MSKPDLYSISRPCADREQFAAAEVSAKTVKAPDGPCVRVGRRADLGDQLRSAGEVGVGLPGEEGCGPTAAGSDIAPTCRQGCVRRMPRLPMVGLAVCIEVTTPGNRAALSFSG